MQASATTSIRSPWQYKDGLDSGLYSRVYLSLRSEANANRRRREEDWGERGRDPVLRAQRLTPAPGSDAGRFPEVRGNRCRDFDLCPPRAGSRVQAQRDPRTFETERGSPAARSEERRVGKECRSRW